MQASSKSMTHFHTLNKSLDQMLGLPLERRFMMLLLMDVMLNPWIENPMELGAKSPDQETLNSFTMIELVYG